MKENEKNVVVAGHICLDIIPEMLTEANVINDILRPGKLVNVGKARISTGGSVSNTGLALNRLGINVKLMGKCGDDEFGWTLLQKLKDEAAGAESGMQVVPGETTSYTVVIAPPGIDRMLLHCCGANDTFCAEDIDMEAVKQAELLHLGYPPLLRCFYENDGEQLARVFSNAKTAEVTTSLDMSLPDPKSISGQIDWEKILNATLSWTDIFLPSVEELLFMLRRSTFDNLSAKSEGDDFLNQIDSELLSDLAGQCLELGAGIVVIKCGSNGIYIRTADQQRLKKIGRAQPGDLGDWANREIFEPSFNVEEIVSAAGSGDNTIAGFLAAYLRGCSIEDAISCACAVGAHNVQVPDAVSGVKNWEETISELPGWAKNEINISLADWEFDSQVNNYKSPKDKV